MTVTELFGEVIHSYSRAQALADRVLVAADEELLSEAGFTIPLAYTAAVHRDCIAWPEADAGQDREGREWDVLWMLHVAIRRNRYSVATDRVEFEMVRVPRGGQTPEPVRLVAVCGPGDDGEPVLTVMQPGES